MCGINGIVLSDSSRRTIDVRELERMRDVLTHRGPDDAGVFVNARRTVGLGHRRLSIVDVNAGHQPMTNEDHSLRITYNGEIYNHADYRETLETRGHVYSSHCDTETILHLYEEYGTKCVHHLRGMFAFAIWDENRRELFVARDRLGVKPLYYAHASDGSLYFASEIKALLQVNGFRAEVNYEVLPDYFANHAPSGEETLFSGIKRLLPGHTLIWRNGSVWVEKYWDIQFSSDADELSDKQYVEKWNDLFRESVRLRLMADVPLGMFLSGGIDSSAIAAVMSTMVSEPIKTFSVAFAEREANELEYARLVARTFATDHHEVVVSPEEFFAALPRLVWHEDEPIAHPSSVALFFVSQLASQHVKVVLTGEGSDELLAGYGRYRKTILNVAAGHRYQSLVPRSLRESIRRRIESLPTSSLVRQKLQRTFLSLSPGLESIYFDNFAVFPRKLQEQLFTSSTRDRARTFANPYSQMQELITSTDASSLLNQILFVDLKTYLHELLMKQDQMSMAASIESRVPFLDQKLVEFSAAMPDRLKLRGATTKYILRESMKGILPEAILSRSKMGFPVPIGKWFRGPFRNLIDEFVLGERAMSRGIFDRAFVKSIVARHNSGEEHSERLWALLNFEIWQRRFIDGEDVKREEPAELELVNA